MNHPQSSDAGADPQRRALLKSVIGLGAASVVGRPAAAQEDGGSTNFPPSPATRPWLVQLPLRAPKQPVAALNPLPTATANRAGGECGRGTHQGWSTFVTGILPPKFYETRVVVAGHEFHPDLTRLQSPNRPDQIWGFDGVFPGPTFVARYGEPVLLRIRNELPARTIGYGSPEMSTHLHNGHTPSESDGFAGDYFSRTVSGPTLAPLSAGQFRDHLYPNCYAGFLANRDPSRPYGPANCGDTPAGRGAEGQGTLWYHDHRHDFTAANVYRGMAGFYLLFDHLDTGNENDTSPTALRLPSGVGRYDVPLLIQDRRFDAFGYSVFEQFDSEGVLGDKIVVNGKIQPFTAVERRKYRFRILNGGPSRFYRLEFADEAGRVLPFDYIANDGNLLPAPLRGMTSVYLGVGERADIVVDFRNAPSRTMYLVNRLEQRDTRGPERDPLTPGMRVLRFDVGNKAVTDRSQVPDVLRPLPPLPDLSNAVRRYWEFNRNNGSWAVNGKLFDMNFIAAQPIAGKPEIWTFKNGGTGWHHPIHFHLEEGRLLTRNGSPPPPHEQGRKDVFTLAPGEEVSVAVTFRDFPGKYMMHCHNLFHEDHAMMIRFDVQASGSTL